MLIVLYNGLYSSLIQALGSISRLRTAPCYEACVELFDERQGGRSGGHHGYADLKHVLPKMMGNPPRVKLKTLKTKSRKNGWGQQTHTKTYGFKNSQDSELKSMVFACTRFVLSQQPRYRCSDGCQPAGGGQPSIPVPAVGFLCTIVGDLEDDLVASGSICFKHQKIIQNRCLDLCCFIIKYSVYICHFIDMPWFYHSLKSFLFVKLLIFDASVDHWNGGPKVVRIDVQAMQIQQGGPTEAASEDVEV